MLSPASTYMISPTTSSFESIVIRLLFLNTLVVEAVIFFKASRLFSALFSWNTPSNALTITTIKIIKLSIHSDGSMIIDITAASNNIIINMSANCIKNLTMIFFFFFSTNSLLP